MRRYGLKLWSINRGYLPEALRLHREGLCDYIELFVVPGSCAEYAALWAGLDIPFIIHAPHFDKGMNLSDSGALAGNLTLAREAIDFADRLKADTIIFHPGVEGDFRETARQLKLIAEPRIVIENKPHFGHNDVVCVGSTPAEIAFIMAGAGVGFCLDVGHAICAANATKAPPLEYLEQFVALGPRMFHLSDGSYSGNQDRHDHFGTGDYDIRRILQLLPSEAVITVETEKDDPARLDDFAADIHYLRSLTRAPGEEHR